MIVTNDPTLAERARVLVNVGQRGGEEYLYDAIGYNYRMTNMAGAMGRTQLTHLDSWNKSRRDHAALYTAAFASLPWLVPPVEPPGYVHVYNQYTVRVPQDREKFLTHLSDHRIGRRVYYPHLVPQSRAYQQLGFRGTYPVAERLTTEVVSLPVHPALSSEDVSRILDVVARFPGARG
jgi:dTDP-4-amino-4,6-dideoxygalactose transaminase